MLLHPREGEKGRLNSIVPITVRPGSEDSGRGVYVARLALEMLPQNNRKEHQLKNIVSRLEVLYVLLVGEFTNLCECDKSC